MFGEKKVEIIFLQGNSVRQKKNDEIKLKI